MRIKTFIKLYALLLVNQLLRRKTQQKAALSQGLSHVC